MDHWFPFIIVVSIFFIAYAIDKRLVAIIEVLQQIRDKPMH
jgi:hypothetical protein